jgi:hypothetical protein
VNGERKIEIIKPFGEAFELMTQILFKPFSFEKWLIIGFAAFLSGHLSAGGFNFPFGNWNARESTHNISPTFEEWKPWLPIVILCGGAVFLALIVLFAWLKARGNFIFTDCIVRNRGAIAGPWREYRREGNSYFLFSLAVALCAMITIGLVAIAVIIPLGIFGQARSEHEMTPIIIVLFILFGMAWLCFAIFFALISYFMIPVMYIRRCRALDAFWEVARLILDNGASFVLFCLFTICLVIGTGMISGIATCATCCLAALPYVGTVILLPVFVCLRAFGLCFIRQFGPEYDVWTGVAATAPPPATTPEPPPLPS